MRTLSQVDLADNRNLIIVAVSVALGIIPAAAPDFYEQFPQAVRIIFESGITAAAVADILLNVVFNILGARYETPTLSGETASHVPAANREEI